MTKRILWSVLAALILILSLAVFLTINATSETIGMRQENQLREIVSILWKGYEMSGPDFLANVSEDSYNITVISPHGKVLNDELEDAWYLVTDNKALDKFLLEVLTDPGIVSTHTHYLYGELILAGASLPDNTVIVVSTTLSTFMATLLEMKVSIVSIIFMAVIMSVILAEIISRFIVRPLNEIDIEKPLEKRKGKYKEILPLLEKIASQKESISLQQEDLARNRDEFNAVTESLVEGLILVAGDNSISFINRSAMEILDIHDSAEGKNCRSVFPASLMKILDDTKINGTVTTIYSMDPKVYQVETTTIKDRGISVLLYDITQRVHTENERREFTANVSHELKTPIHIIQGSAELLLSPIMQEEDKPQFINQIYHESQRMARLVDDIIRLSRMEEANEMVKEVYPISVTANTICSNLLPVANERGVNLIVETDDSAMVYADEPMIYRIIFNLVDNAIKYTEKGGSVTVRTFSEEKDTILEVNDTGIGIPEHLQGKVFERFFRVDKSRSKAVGGTGLGLAIVKEAVASNGGQISLTSTPGVGTRFRVTFPSSPAGE